MMKFRHSVLLLLLINLIAASDLPSTLVGQDKRPLEHEDYELWSSITSQSISHDGNWVMFTVTKGDDKSTLHIRHAKSQKQYEIQNGSSGQFSFDSKHAVFRVSPDPELLKKLKKEKRKPEEMPQVKLQILNLSTGNLESIERTRSFALPAENGEWLAVQLLKPFDEKTVKETKSPVKETYEITEEGLKRPKKKVATGSTSQESKKKTETKKESGKEKANTKKEDDKKVKKNDKKKAAGTTLIVRNMVTGSEQRIPNVTSFRFSKMGAHLAYATSTEDQPEGDGVSIIELASGSTTNAISGLGNYRGLTFSEDENHLALMTDRDDYDSKTSSMAVYHWKTGQKEAAKVAAEGSDGIPEGWWVASRGSLVFSDDLRRLYFNTAPKPEDSGDDDEKEEEEPKAKLDLWHWKDPQLQPQQLLQAAQERNRSYRAAFDLKSKKIVQLATVDMPTVSFDRKSTSDIGIGVTNMRYRKVSSWDFPGFQDTYLVDLTTGQSRMILEATRQGGSLSPDAKFVTWWDAEKLAYFAMSTAEGSSPVEISTGIPHSLANELHDTPSPVRPYGGAGWTQDEKGLLVYDRFDIWQLDPTGAKEPVCITEGFGRENSLRLRYVRTDPEARFVDTSMTMLLSAFNEATKASGYYKLRPESEGSSEEFARGLEKMLMLDERLGRMTKARDSDAIILTRSTFQRFPDIWYSSLAFKSMQRMSNANPQQGEYAWGSAELVHWDATDGQKLDGLLYKPEGFDPNKKYPLMVYFYERNSDNLHSYYVPAAGRSIINHSFYVSRGYVLFVPDIPYKTGEPGPSAANSILPGVKSIVDLGYIDESKIGMQGHSWGGYQTAYLVTQTDMFACAESGAPVSNMTSAYGGIRWGSGMSRMFQYERTQSRIGEDLWSAREKYLANSPVFFADKINTPLLILHNDEDGAVPWYQGIELFVAMRRLEKPCWMMNYNGEPHWVMKKENRLDFAIRMQQFFDHYLMDAPMPEWMATGIPAVDKGKKFGLEPAAVQPSEEKSTEGSETVAETSETKSDR